MSSLVRSIDDLRRLRLAAGELSDQWKVQAMDLQRLAERLRQWVVVEQVAYWQHQTRLAERRLQASLEGLARTQMTAARGGAGSTDAAVLVEQCKRRLAFCRQRQAACRHWSREIDRRVARFLGELGALREAAESSLPLAADRLARWIDALDRYAEAAGPKGAGSPEREPTDGSAAERPPANASDISFDVQGEHE